MPPDLAPAPAAPALDSPAAAPSPAPAPPQGATPAFDDAFPDDGLDTPPAPPPEPAGKTPAAEPPDKPDVPAKHGKVADKPADKLPDKAAPAAPVPEHDFTPPQVAKPNELRTWANRMGARAQKAEAEISKLSAKLTQLESQPAKQGEDTTVLAQELAATKKLVADYENRLQLTAFERSDKYQREYQKPYQDAFARAYREVQELIVFEPNPEDPENPRERAATKADFDEIYSLPLGQASRIARQKFGDGMSIVLGHRQKIRDLAESAYTAIQDFKAKAGEFETQTKAERATQTQAMEHMFRLATDAHAKKQATMFLEREGDAEGNELLAKGKQFAAAVFGGNEGLSPQNVAFRDAMAFNRLSAYPRLVRDVRKLMAELEQANATIESLRSSGPGTPEPGASKVEKGGYKPFDQAFDEAVPG